jgi:hypothetical protein
MGYALSRELKELFLFGTFGAYAKVLSLLSTISPPCFGQQGGKS